MLYTLNNAIFIYQSYLKTEKIIKNEVTISFGGDDFHIV